MSEVNRIIDDPHGEPLAIALAALGVSSDVAARIFIFGDPVIGHSYSKVRRLVTVVETLSSRAAHQLLTSMLGRSSEPMRRGMPIQDEFVRTRREGQPARRDPVTAAPSRRANGNA